MRKILIGIAVFYFMFFAGIMLVIIFDLAPASQDQPQKIKHPFFDDLRIPLDRMRKDQAKNWASLSSNDGNANSSMYQLIHSPYFYSVLIGAFVGFIFSMLQSDEFYYEIAIRSPQNPFCGAIISFSNKKSVSKFRIFAKNGVKDRFVLIILKTQTMGCILGGMTGLACATPGKYLVIVFCLLFGNIIRMITVNRAKNCPAPTPAYHNNDLHVVGYK